MTGPSRRWKAVPRLTVRETNAAPEAEAWTRDWKMLKQRGVWSCRCEALFMLFTKPRGGQHKGSHLTLGRKEKAKAACSGRPRSRLLYNHLPETHPRRSQPPDVHRKQQMTIMCLTFEITCFWRVGITRVISLQNVIPNVIF